MNFDMQNICRCCFLQREMMISLDLDDSLPDRLLAMSPRLKVSQEDELPKSICNVCIVRLNLCIKTQAQFELADVALRDFAKNKDKYRLQEWVERLNKLSRLTNIHEVVREKEKYIRPITKVDSATWTEKGNEEDQMVNFDAVFDILLSMEAQENLVEDVSAEQNNDDLLLQGNIERRKHTTLHGELKYKESVELNSAEIQLQGPVTCKSTSHSRDSKVTALVMPKEKQNVLQVLPNATLGQQIITDKSSTESDASPADISTNEARSTNTTVLKPANTSPLVPNGILDASSSESSGMPIFEILQYIAYQRAIKAVTSVVNKEMQALKAVGIEHPVMPLLSRALKQLSTRLYEFITAEKLAVNTASSVLNETQSVQKIEKLEPNKPTKIQLLTSRLISCTAAQNGEQSCLSALNVINRIANQLNTFLINVYNSAKAKEATTLTLPETNTKLTARETVMSQMEISVSADQNLTHQLLTRRNVETQTVAEENTHVNESIDISLDTNTGRHTMEVENSMPVKQLEMQFLEKNTQRDVKETEAQKQNPSSILVIKKCVVSKKEGLTLSDKSIAQASTLSSSVIGLQSIGLGGAAGTEVVKDVHSQLPYSVSSSSRLPNMALQINTAEMQILEGDFTSQAEKNRTLVLENLPHLALSPTSAIPNSELQMETTEMPILEEDVSSQAEESQALLSLALPCSVPFLTPNSELQMKTAEMQTLKEDVSSQAEEGQAQVSVDPSSVSSPTLGIPNTGHQMEKSKIQMLERGFSSQAEEIQRPVSLHSVLSLSFPMLRTQYTSQQMEREETPFLLEQETQIPETSNLEHSIGRETEDVSFVSAEALATEKCISSNEESQIMASQEPMFSASSPIIAMQKTPVQMQEAKTSFLLEQQETQICGTSKLKCGIGTEVGEDIALEPAGIPATEKCISSKTEDSQVLSASTSKVGIQNTELETMQEAEEPIPLKQTKTQILERSKFKNVAETEVEQDISFETTETDIQATKKLVTSEARTLASLEPPFVGSSNPKLTAMQATKYKQSVRMSPTKELDESKRGTRCRRNKIRTKARRLDIEVVYDQTSVRKGCISDETKSRKRKATEDVTNIQQDSIQSTSCTKTDLFICEPCVHEYYDGYELDEHIAECHKDVKLRIMRHIQDETTNKFIFSIKSWPKQTCPYCGLVIEKASFEDHLKCHGVKPIVCTKCGRGFSTKEYFDKHKCKNVNKTMKFENCHIELPGASVLMMNKLEKYECVLCSKSFGFELDLLQHIKTVHVNPLKCVPSGQPFKAKTGLDVHVSKHCDGENQKEPLP